MMSHPQKDKCSYLNGLLDELAFINIVSEIPTDLIWIWEEYYSIKRSVNTSPRYRAQPVFKHAFQL